MADTKLDLTDPAFHADPHPVYAQLRRTDPVRRVQLPEGGDAWLVTRYEDAKRALSDPRLSKAFPDSRPTSPVAAAISRHMLAVDPPDHTRLRRLVSAAFTARRVEELRPRIEEITAGLLDDMAGRDEVDLIDAFAFPLPIQVICELLGVPADDRDAFRAWTNVIVGGPQPGVDHTAALGSMVGYIQDLLARRRRHGGDDLLAALLDVRDSADRLGEEELISMVFLLLIAGHETTVNLIGNGAWLLLSHPARWERLRAEPALLPAAVEEMLRYEAPVETATFRVATTDLTIGEQRIAAGDQVVVGLLAANRDDRFTDPDDVVLDRETNPHLAFGHGIHYCLGAPLARLEAVVAFGRLAERFPGLRLARPEEQPEWRPGLLLRGLQHLPVRLGVAAPG